MLDEDRLKAEFLSRIERAPQGFPPVAALAVVKDVRLPTFIRSSLTFVSRLSAEDRESWLGSFTRTIFLAGDPANLAERFPPAWLAEDGSVAWFAPGPVDGRMALRRLLRPFRGTCPGGAPAPERTHVRPQGSRTARVWILESLSLQDVMVHLNHVIAEAALDGLLDEVNDLTFQYVRRIPDPQASRVLFRVAENPDEPGHLRCYAALATSRTEG